MRFLSLFSGIEACSVAWKPLGWECAGFSEIEPYPCSLLAHHYHDVPNLGDITKITEQQIADLGDFDLVVFGSPCQDLSAAGTRKGFQDGTRSNLFYEALRIFDYARKHNNCRFALWENVPGAFSSNKGADFTAVVREMAGLEDVETPEHGWGNTGAALGTQGLLEWRVLDAQYFGLAQRRKRVFAVLDTGDWYNRPPILFEQENVRGDTPPSRTAGCEHPTTVETSPRTGSEPTGLAYPANTVTATHHHAVAYTIHADPTPKVSDGVSGTLRSQGGGGIVPPNVVYGFQPRPYSNVVQGAPTLCATDYKDPMTLITHSVVRRLTPMECERLQGFPDGYTDVPHNGKPASKSARYKALGNSMAVPVMRYIAEQLENAVNYNRIER